MPKSKMAELERANVDPLYMEPRVHIEMTAFEAVCLLACLGTFGSSETLERLESLFASGTKETREFAAQRIRQALKERQGLQRLAGDKPTPPWLAAKMNPITNSILPALYRAVEPLQIEQAKTLSHYEVRAVGAMSRLPYVLVGQDGESVFGAVSGGVTPLKFTSREGAEAALGRWIAKSGNQTGMIDFSIVRKATTTGVRRLARKGESA